MSTQAPPESRRDDTLPRPPPPDETGSHIWLYSGEVDDAPVRLDSPLPDLGKKDLLWADVDVECVGDLSPLWERLGVGELMSGIDLETGPALVLHDGVMELVVTALGGKPDPEPMTLRCLVGPNWVVTLHRGELDLVDEFNEPFHGDNHLGDLDGPVFLSMVLDWQLSAYFKVIEDLQVEIDRLDEELLSHAPDGKMSLGKLQTLRTRVRGLRNILGPHREVLGIEKSSGG